MNNNKINPKFQDERTDAMREIVRMVFEMPSFMSATITFKTPLEDDGASDIRVRPVDIKGDALWQIIRGSNSENLGLKAARKTVQNLLRDHPVDEAHVTTGDGDFHCRISKKGRALVSKSRKPVNRDAVPTRTHDHEKDYPLTRFDSALVLRVLGIADERDEIKPSMRAKFRQVNEFLRILDAAWEECGIRADKTVNIFDIGCGKAYLSFAAKAYLEAVKNATIRFTGIDRNDTVITSCRRMADALGWTETMTFAAEDIVGFTSENHPDIVLSLHACDTATDEALAFGVERKARIVLCAPCCQHELSKKLDASGPNRAILRNGILRERLADILTDAFRAQIMRVTGYRTNVVEFVEPDATARNILIRASRISRKGTGTALDEYLALRDEWHCMPFLAERLATAFPELVAE